MDVNETAQSIINPALLPNFFFLLSLFLMMGYLWYLYDYKPSQEHDEDETTPGPKDRD